MRDEAAIGVGTMVVFTAAAVVAAAAAAMLLTGTHIGPDEIHVVHAVGHRNDPGDEHLKSLELHMSDHVERVVVGAHGQTATSEAGGRVVRIDLAGLQVGPGDEVSVRVGGAQVHLRVADAFGDEALVPLLPAGQAVG